MRWPMAAGEQADAAVEVEGHVVLAGQQALHDGADQGVGGLRVDLPEAAGADAVGAVVGTLADEGAAVDAVDAAVALVDAHHRDGLVELDQGQCGRRASG